MSPNMSILDRRLRAFLVAPAAVVIGAVLGQISAVAIVLYAVAAIMLATSAVSVCPLYTLLHIDSRGRKPLAH